MEGAVVSYAEGVAKALVGKLGLLLSEEYQLLGGVRGEVVGLRDEVAIMNALLRMLAEADHSAVNHFVREWMKQVRELAYDAEDCIDLFVRRISCAPHGALGGARHLLATLRARHRLASDIKDLRARALAVSERRARYDVDSQALRPSVFFSESASAAVTPSANVLGATNDPDQFVGMEDQVRSLSEMLLPEDNKLGKKLKVVSIVGFGGLGKTTLAKEVCRRLEEEFVYQSMVSVSQAFDANKDMNGLLGQILRQLLMVRRDKQKGMQEEDIVTPDVDPALKLKNFLSDKRYLIVIDDVWTIKAWDSIRAKLADNNHGSRVIVTTRIETVAKACIQANTWSNNIIHVKHLELEDSEKLFVNRVFGPNNACPPELAKAKDGILKKCGGLPLAIVSIASLLASHKSPGSIGMWDRVSNSIGSQMESNPTLEGMRHIITLSYNHLPHHLKACMMYLSIFPEDYMVSKERLLERWIAEGLVPEMRGLTSQEVAEACYEELLSRNMIKPGYVECDGEVVQCCVHDMMLEVIVSKSLEENFVSLIGGQEGGTAYDNVRRLSIQGEDSRSLAPGMGMRHVRSLTTFRHYGHRKVLDRLPDFTLLRVLDLEDCKDVENKNMKHVCRLFLLRYLNLNGTDISLMPIQIGNLLHLQILRIFRTLLKELPDSVVKLEKLEHLSFCNRDNWRILLRLPRGIGRMKSLYGLSNLEICEDDVEFAREIGDLVQLRYLQVVLRCNDCYDGEVLRELASSIGKICSLENLGIQDMSDGANNMMFLHDISPPPLLIRFLNIGGTIDRFPDWVESLTHLTNIVLWWINLHSDQIYGVLCKLPSLLKLGLDRSCCKDEELVARTTFKFQVLRELFVVPYGPVEYNPRVIKFEEGSMITVEKLAVRFDDLERTVVGVENLTNLKEVELAGMRGNTALYSAVEQFKAESNSRQESNRFKVLLKYV